MKKCKHENWVEVVPGRSADLGICTDCYKYLEVEYK